MPDACPAQRGKQICKQLAEFVSTHTVIVGMGNRQKGDDGLAPAVIESLEGKIPVPLIDTGTSPENFTQVIAAYKPDSVLFVDAAEIGRNPGEMALYSADEIMSVGISTHTGNVSLLEQYIHSVTGARSVFLLVQPADVKYRSDPSADDNGPGKIFLSPAVSDAVKQICRVIVSLFDSEQTNGV